MQNFDVLVYEGRLLLAGIKENFREAEESMMWFCGVTVSVRRDYGECGLVCLGLVT